MGRPKPADYFFTEVETGTSGNRFRLSRKDGMPINITVLWFKNVALCESCTTQASMTSTTCNHAKALRAHMEK